MRGNNKCGSEFLIKLYDTKRKINYDKIPNFNKYMEFPIISRQIGLNRYLHL